MKFGLILLLAVFAPGLARADLGFLPEAEMLEQRAVVAAALARDDEDALRRALESSHLFIQREIALHLGRRGSVAALPRLRELDKTYANFACSRSGEFGVAVALIENKTPAARKAALLALATATWHTGRVPLSVVDEAGRELSRYEGDDIGATLAGVNTYGAQFTVLSARCAKLPEPQAIARCVDVLEAHETPQTAGAAGELLVAFGAQARTPVEALKARTEAGLPPEGSALGVRHTVVSRCESILQKIAPRP